MITFTSKQIFNLKRFFAFAALFSLVMAGGIREAKATHAAGADLTYRCLGGLQYELEVTFYRDCGGVAEPSNIVINYASVSGNHNLNATANKIAGTGLEITVPCQTSSSSCNGGSSTGIRKFVYRVTVTLPSARADWKFSYSVCCRNCSITTILNPCANSSLLYVEATLNNLSASCNSSPTFSNIPIAFVCTGQTFNYNHGVLDIDGDSLAYEFIAPKISATTNVTFIPPASITTPVSSSTPFTLNAITGQITFTPNQVQIGIMAIRIKEYRNNVLIGTVIRDMQVYTTICSNNLPTASGINNTSNFTANACANQQLCFDVFTADADAAQAVTITSNNGIAGATYTVNPGTGSRPSLHFCWTPNVSHIDLSPHTFTVTVQDNACPSNGIQTFSYSVYVTAPDFNITSSNVACNGANNGSATAVPVYAGPQTYLWSNGQTTATANNLAPGTYTVTLTNGNGCTISKSVIITQPSVLASSSSQTNISCAGLCNGGVDLTVTGGTAPYSYVWSNGQTTQDLTNRCIGAYTVTITDANGCTSTRTVNLINVSNIAASVAGTNVLCNAGNSGTADLTVSGGVAPYSYAWSNGATTQDLSGVAAGTYTVTVTDANACTKNASVTLTQPAAALSSSVSSSVAVSCFGGNNGAINLNVSGGTAPYSYDWSTGATTQNISGLASGSYTVTVTDANGCASTTASISITQPSASLSASAGSVSSVSCNGGNNGSITLSVAGGTSPYSYAWSNGATTQNLSGLSTGNYTITVTDANACVVTTSAINVSQPAAALSSRVTSSSAVSCFGGNNGSINFSVNGGTAPYSYSWSNGSTSQNLSGLPAGNYTVTVTDAHGCTHVASAITISQPAAALNGSASSVGNVSCYGGSNGSIILSASGGTAPYLFSWSNGSTSQNLTNVGAGNYSVTITDVNGCTHTVNAVAVTEPAAPLAAGISASNDVSCNGGSNGSINLNVSGGTAPYSYSWSNGATTQNISNVPAGSYSVTVTDNKGCTQAVSAVTISQPSAALSATVGAVTNVSCHGDASGDINLTVNGGTSPYTYVWSNGANTQDLNNVASGTYTVTVTDANGCTDVMASITISQPSAALNGNATTTQNVSCSSGANGAISLTVNGGTSPYSYSWSNGTTTQNISGLYAGNYVVTITDANGCTANASSAVTQPAGSLNSSINTTQQVSCNGGSNGSINLTVSGGTTPYNYQWSNGATTQDITNLSSGSYTVTVMDVNGCINVSTAVVSQPLAALSTGVSAQSAVSCFGGNNGTIDLTVNGGTAPYSYAWSNGSTAQDQFSLAAGNYTVTVTDANGCTSVNSALTITQPAAALSGAVSSSGNVNCFGGSNGSVSLNISGGTAPYSYSWSNGASTQNISGLSAGSYSVVVSDVNGCTTALSSLVISQPANPLASSASSVTSVSCFGGNNGAISLNVNGGTAPYTYVWNNGATTQNISNLSSGNYTVTITDVNGCTDVTSGIAINQPAASLSGSVSSTSEVSCFGGNNGSVNLSVNGGTAPYTYVWSNGATTQNISGVISGLYTVTITDVNGCTDAISGIVISQPAASLNGSVSSTGGVSCWGGNNGGIALNVTGGTSPYSYQWNNGATTQNLNNINAGTYTVTITDVNGCSDGVSGIIVSQPAASLSLSVNTVSAVSCFGGNNGNINLNITGGTSPYTYSWSNGSTSQNLVNAPAGNYSVIVTDANGCTDGATAITISQPAAALSSSVSSISAVSCNGGNNGSINLNISGGTTPYTYSWSNGATTQDLNGVVSGTYTVTIADANGCTTINSGIAVSQPAAALNTSVSTATPVSCNSGSNGSITLNVSGGTTPYTYIWSNGSTTQNISNISAGSYTVTVTDVNGCTDAVTGITVSQPPVALGISVSSVTAVSCFGGNNGDINLGISGGTLPYTFNWSNGSTTQNLSNVVAGTYNVIVTDANGCTIGSSAITISQPAAALSSSVVTVSSVSCNGGNNGGINLFISGGTIPYTYAWSNGATTQDLNGIPAGTYTVTITDVNGCTTINSGITISEPPAAVNANIVANNSVSCFGGTNGSLNLTVNGGTIPYTYSWSNGSTSQNLLNVPAGTYSVTITDFNGCSVSITGQTISQPAGALNGSASSTTAVSCFGGNNGAINLAVNGGTLPYTYNWSNGSTTQNISNLASGTYTVTVTDINGCTTMVSGIAINQPAAAISASATTTQNVSCNSGGNGSVTLTVTGGTAPYTFVWSTGATTQNINGLYSGTYVVTITDSQGCTESASATVSQPPGALSSTINVSQNVNCFGGSNGSISLNASGGTLPYSYNWSNGATTQNISNLLSGTYSVTITDANGCINMATAVVDQPVAALSSAVQSTTAVNCFGGNNGAINLTVNGGTLPYTYNWSNGETTQNISNLASGTYTVIVTDVNGCTTEVAGIAINQPAAALSGNVSSTTAVSCFGGNNGAINLTVNGGTIPYAYLWNNGATTQNINNLATGTYTVTVTDVNGCTTEVTGININQPTAPLSASASSTINVSCFGGVNGFIDITTIDGTSPYTYNWSNGETTEDINNLSSGTYTVMIIDANGCTVSVSVFIAQPSAPLNATVNVTQNVNCFGGANGSIDLTATDGTAPYTYSWSNGETTEDISSLSSGTYTVTVTDVNGCTFVTSATISQPVAPLNATAIVTSNVDCFTGATGTIDLTVTDGTSPYIYIWNNGETTEDISNLNAGTYTVTVTDANGCVTTATATITQPAGSLTATVNVTQNVNCYGGSNGSIDLTATDGTAPYSYQWNNGATTEDISNLAAGTYAVTVTDANGCSFTISATISQPSAALNGSGVVTQNVSCNAGTNGTIDLTVADGTAPYTYSWSNGATTEDISNLVAGTYTVTVTDANGCTFTTSLTVIQPAAALNTNVSITQNVSCFAGANGSIDLTATDGTPPYTYSWSNGATTEDISNLSAGTYTVTVTDANGCTTTATGTITQPTASLSAGTSVTQNVSCNGGNNGSITLTVNGGTGPYTYNWSNGDTTQNISNLASGNYAVTITDANGCTAIASAAITQPAAALNASLNITQNVNCNAGNDGSINLTTTGGTGPYTYNWSNGATTEDITNLAAGIYTVTVTDANNCTTVSTATITQPSNALTVTTNGIQPVSCFGGNNGTITLTVTGGTAPYTYSWSNGATTQDLNNISSGTYTVTVTDNNGCTQTAMAVITEPTATVTVSGSGSSSNCLNQQPGTVTINPNGGTLPYIYNWSNGATTQDLTNVSAGNYTVTITDALGCTTTGSYAVTDISTFSASATGPTTVCLGELVTMVADSIPGASYQWYLNGQLLGGATYNVFVTPAGGSYTVTITHPCGTFTSDSINVTVHTIDNITVSPNVILCPGESTQLNASGGTSYEWTPADGLDYTNVPNPVATPPQTTVYTVTVTNDYGCKTTGTVEIGVLCDTLLIPSGFSPNGDGVNDGFEIVGIDNYPGNKIWIYNRWGNLIFKTQDYSNNWSGQSNVSGLYIGKKVPNGTYFYILDLNNKTKPLQGYIVLRY